MTYTGFLKNSACTGVDFSQKLGFMKILHTPVFPLSEKQYGALLQVYGLDPLFNRTVEAC